MHSKSLATSTRFHRALFAIALTVAAIVRSGAHACAAVGEELRGVWIASEESDVFRSRAAIADAMEFLARHHINVVYPAVWYAGVTLHPSRVLDETVGIAQDPRYRGRDPLAEILAEAHVRGIEVVPWFEYGFTTTNDAGPTSLLGKKPMWAARNSDGERLARGGDAWLNAMDPEVQQFVSALVLEVARNYDIDGVQGDERLPALPPAGGYDKVTAELWRKDRRLAPPLANDERWIAWRAGRLTDFLAQLTRDVHDVSLGILVSASPSPYRLGLDEYLQDSKTWMERGIVDLFHPRCYRREVVNYKQLVDEQHALMPRSSRAVFAPGILIQSGSWRMGARELVAMVEHNRDRGYDGEVLFHYSALRAKDGELARALSSGPYAEPARVPHRATQWRPKARDFAPRLLPDAKAWARERGYARAANSGRAEIVYSLDTPTSGWFQVLVEIPDVEALPAFIERTFVGRDVPGGRVAPTPGLVDVGTVQLSAAGAPIELRITTRDDEQGRLAVGRAFIVLDRKRSTDAVWR